MSRRGALRLVQGDREQVPRLEAFRYAHPDVVIGTFSHGGAWQARFTDDGKETTLTRYILADLLDKLDETFPPR